MASHITRKLFTVLKWFIGAGQDNREFKCEGFHESNGNTLDQNSVDICEKGGKGVFLPIFESEADMSNALRALLYFFGLLWLFAGVAIVADVFMAAIETITSQQRAVTYIVDNKVRHCDKYCIPHSLVSFPCLAVFTCFLST